MMKKFMTCAAIAAAAVALGAGTATANEDEHRDRLVAAGKIGGSFESLKTSSGTGIWAGSVHHSALVSVMD
ncbi:hypothetical protein ACLGIH_22425 [Streptomyces sp. HMX87]|uniref:hypothetical protein n=1 Tax=Streptomyces sp. HMX87 TaxID=3390849 RepID=UPI003A8A1C8C